MTDNLQEEISKLYALRAGMSVISIEREKTSQILGEIGDRKAKNNAQIDKVDKKIEEKEEELRTWRERANGYVLTPKAVKKLVLGWILIALVLAFFTVTVAGVCWWVYLSKMPSNADEIREFCKTDAWWNTFFMDWVASVQIKIAEHKYGGFFSFLQVVIMIVVIGLSFCLGGWCVVWATSTAYVGMPDIYAENIKCKKEQKEAPSKIEALKKELDDLIKEKKLIVDNGRKISIYPKELTDRIDSCEIFYCALEREFSSALDVRDWANLDLIIYLYETGRALNKQEALKQVDEYKRAEILQSLIMEACQTICDTLNRGFARLNRTLNVGFASLQSQISAMQQQMAVGQIAQYQAIKELSSSTNMTNALLKNISSSQSAEDIHYMRTLAQNAETRRLNNVK